MKKAKAFLLFKDNKEIIVDLSDEKAGKLIKAIYKYECDDESPDFDGDQVLELLFKMFRIQLDRQRKEYDSICEKRAVAGRKGGKQTQANASKKKQTQANQPNIKEIKTNIIKSWVGIDE